MYNFAGNLPNGLSKSEKCKIIDELNHLKSKYQNQKCLFPCGCQNPPINSHTIQEAKLKLIATENQVYHFDIRGSYDDYELRLIPKKIYTKNASTFRGFCAKHDSNFFSDIENEGKFDYKNRKHLFELFYRSVLMEFDIINNTSAYLVERYKHKDLDVNFWMNYARYNLIKTYKEKIDKIYIRRQYSKLAHLIITFQDCLPLAVSNLASFDINFSTGENRFKKPTKQQRNTILKDYSDEEIERFSRICYMLEPSPSAVFQILPISPNFSIFILSWLKDEESDAFLWKIAKSIYKTENLKAFSSLLLHYAFISCENLYMSIPWFDSFDDGIKKYIAIMQADFTAMENFNYNLDKFSFEWKWKEKFIMK